MEHDPPDGAEAGEVFDHELTHVLQKHERMLDEHSQALLATGATSITTPETTLRARLRAPSRWRRGLLEIAAEDPVSGEVGGSSSIPLDRAGRNRRSLADEIAIHLGFELAHGQSSTKPR
jgi:hypothetical protein